MDTVTESKIAISIAREIWHWRYSQNMPIEEQARQVAVIKTCRKQEMIYDPITIKRGSTVRDALAIMSNIKSAEFRL